MSERTQFQRFEVQTLKRSEIRQADYNPRVMDAYGMSRLRDNLRTRGLLDLLIWNRRTGNLVSGHQRLSALDQLNPGEEYELQVAVVDLDEKTEKEMNVWFNNQNVQGDWDLDKLAEIIPQIKPEKAGLAPFDLSMIFEDTKYSPLFAENRTQNQVVGNAAEIYAEERKKAAEQRREREHDGDANAEPEFYLVVNFDKESERNELFAILKVDPAPTIDGRTIVALIGQSKDAGTAPA